MLSAVACGRASNWCTPACRSTCTTCRRDLVVALEQAFPQNVKRFLPFKPLEGDNQIASFTHLTGYSSAYYTYLWDKVIAEDFFSQFNRNDLLAPEVALRYRSTVLEKTGSMPANDLVKSFLGRPQALDAFKGWMNQEFQGLPASVLASGK